MGPCGPHARPEVWPRVLDPLDPFLALGADFSQGQQSPWKALISWGRVHQGEREERRETHCSIHGKQREGGRQRSPHPKKRCVVGYLLKSPRGSSRASPHPHSSHRAWVSSLGGPDRARGQGGRQMGLREMGSSGYPKATDSNAPGEGGTSCPHQGHHLEKVPRPVPPHVQGPS